MTKQCRKGRTDPDYYLVVALGSCGVSQGARKKKREKTSKLKCGKTETTATPLIYIRAGPSISVVTHRKREERRTGKKC